MMTMAEMYPDYKTNPHWFGGLAESAGLTGIYTDDDLIIDFWARYSQRYPAPINTIWPDRLQSQIIAHYGKSWQHYAEVYNSTYDAIENYNRYEEWSDDNTETVKKSGTDTNETTGSDDINITEDMTKGTTTTVTRTGSLTESRNTKDATTKYGINNNTGHTDTSLAQTGDVTTTDTRGDSTNISGSDNNVVINKTERSNTLKTIYDNLNTLQQGSKHSGHVHGNIGVTTSQQMLMSELELWKWSYLETITDNIATLLTLPIY